MQQEPVTLIQAIVEHHESSRMLLSMVFVSIFELCKLIFVLYVLPTSILLAIIYTKYRFTRLKTKDDYEFAKQMCFYSCIPVLNFIMFVFIGIMIFFLLQNKGSSLLYKPQESISKRSRQCIV